MDAIRRIIPATILFAWALLASGNAAQANAKRGVLPKSQQQDNEYDAAGRLVERTLFAPETSSAGDANGVLALFSWGYDPASNVVQQTETWPGDTARSPGVRTVDMTYDDANYLATETVTAPGKPLTVTTYTYDAAYNRDSKTVSEDGAPADSFSYAFNEANQLTGWTKNNGDSAAYTWDYQNRLDTVTMPNGDQFAYQYDHRTRRIGRDEPDGTTALTYAGGLSLAEYSISDLSSPISAPLAPSVSYRRGPDMGGGIGGMLYSLRDGENGIVEKYSLSNGRGDIVAQTGVGGDLTWSASYEGFGTRPVENGDNDDRQRANTKEEDPTGLLHEHFRYRDLESGVWLSRDPAGFVDGPNLYAYVRQNPWSAFDPLGLEISIATSQKDGKTHHQINFTVAVLIKSDMTAKQKAKAVNAMKTALEAGYKGSDGNVTWSMNAKLTPVESAKEITDKQHRITVGGLISNTSTDGRDMYIPNGVIEGLPGEDDFAAQTSSFDPDNPLKGSIMSNVLHEFGHAAGLNHPKNVDQIDIDRNKERYQDKPFDLRKIEKWSPGDIIGGTRAYNGVDPANPIDNLKKTNIMRYRPEPTNFDVEKSQIEHIKRNFDEKKLNAW